MRRSLGERVFSVFNYCVLIALAVVTLYPFLYVVFASVSEPAKLLFTNGILLKPAGFSLAAYKKVFSEESLLSGYLNTIFYTVVGTGMNMLATVMAAYVLSRDRLMLRRFFTLMFLFTMYFSGGMIPRYILMQNLHLVNTRWAVLLPGLVSTYNLLIMIRGFYGVPASLEESARIDGASHWKVLFNIVLPLAKPTAMVMMMYYAVGHWNAWYNSMLYIRDTDKRPLQLYLRKILIMNNVGAVNGDSVADEIGMTVQYATIIVAVVPILVIYPFIQKHFVSGIMLGAVKG